MDIRWRSHVTLGAWCLIDEASLLKCPPSRLTAKSYDWLACVSDWQCVCVLPQPPQELLDYEVDSDEEWEEEEPGESLSHSEGVSLEPGGGLLSDHLNLGWNSVSYKRFRWLKVVHFKNVWVDYLQCASQRIFKALRASLFSVDVKMLNTSVQKVLLRNRCKTVGSWFVGMCEMLTVESFGMLWHSREH